MPFHWQTTPPPDSHIGGCALWEKWGVGAAESREVGSIFNRFDLDEGIADHEDAGTDVCRGVIAFYELKLRFLFGFEVGLSKTVTCGQSFIESFLVIDHAGACLSNHGLPDVFPNTKLMAMFGLVLPASLCIRAVWTILTVPGLF